MYRVTFATFPWRIAFSLWSEGSLVLCLLSRWSSQPEARRVPPPLSTTAAASPFSPPETSHLYLLAGYASPLISNARCLRSHLCSSRRREAPRIPAGGWSFGRFPSRRERERAWVRLSVSGLMDGLSDFIWAGRTLRWLGPRDCHSWLLYQGLTYWAVVLLEQGSQAPRPARPAPLRPVMLPSRDLGMPPTQPPGDRYIKKLVLIHQLHPGVFVVCRKNLSVFYPLDEAWMFLFSI